MSFTFPIADTLKKIDKFIMKTADVSDVNDVKGSIPRRFLPIVSETVEIIANIYMQLKYSKPWGVFNKKKSPLQYARESVRKVIPSNNRKRSFCMGMFKDIRATDQGSFGKIFTGYKGTTKYAIKQVTLDPSSYEDIGADRIKSELEVTELMSKKGLGPKLYDSYVCKTMGKPHLYLVLEYYNRRSLSDYLQDGNILDEEQIGDISKLIGKMHDLGVIHSDLHAGNILVHQNPNGSLRFAIGDFGMAYLAKDVIQIQKANDINESFTDTMRHISRTVRPVIWKLIREGQIVIDIDIPDVGDSPNFFDTTKKKRVSTK